MRRCLDCQIPIEHLHKGSKRCVEHQTLEAKRQRLENTRKLSEKMAKHTQAIEDGTMAKG